MICPFCGNSTTEKGMAEARTVGEIVQTASIVRFYKVNEEGKKVRKGFRDFERESVRAYYCATCKKVHATFTEME